MFQWHFKAATRKYKKGIFRARQRRLLPFIIYDQALSESTGVKVIGIDFSDPQGGKGAADRLAEKCKGHVRVYINEDNDV